jgi:hypothetical protein
MNPLFTRSRPRGAADLSDTPLAAVPALARLARCKTSADALSVMTAIPEELWPLIARSAARRRYIEPDAMRTVVELVGKDRLLRALGRAEGGNIWLRFRRSEHLQ